jgi:hypothetical protein
MDQQIVKATWTTTLSDGHAWNFGVTEIPSNVFKGMLDDQGIKYTMNPPYSGKSFQRVEFVISPSDSNSKFSRSKVHDLDCQYDDELRRHCETYHK